MGDKKDVYEETSQRAGVPADIVKRVLETHSMVIRDSVKKYCNNIERLIEKSK